MPFNIINTVIDHSSDAGFRAWAQEFHALLLAAGWVNTADTGQVDLTTMLKPAAITAAGYKIYYLNDSLHASAPCYLKWEPGSGGTSTAPQFHCTLGVATNGAGTLTGVFSARSACVHESSNLSTVIARNTYVTWGDGYFSVAWKAGGSGPIGYGFFSVNRFTDAIGTPVADGYAMYNRTTTGVTCQQHCISFLTSTAYPISTTYCMIGGAVTNSLVAGVAQTYRHYVIKPRMQLNPFALTVLNSELTAGNVFQADVIGTGLKDWMPVGLVMAGAAVTGASGIYGMAIPWEA